MYHFILRNHIDNTEIFSGEYASLIACLEDAVSKNIDLSSVDLRHQNLSNANLDGASMPNAHFAGANLTGVNLSEANLRSSIFFNADLYNICMAFSILNGSDFRMAQFGGTIISGALLQNCIFSNLSCFDLDFTSARSITGSCYIAEDGKIHKMSQQPIVVKGFLNSHIIVLDHSIKIGMKLFPKKFLPNFMTMFSKSLLNDNYKRGDKHTKIKQSF
nr:hypothetical protein [Cytophagales bacterium]